MDAIERDDPLAARLEAVETPPMSRELLPRVLTRTHATNVGRSRRGYVLAAVAAAVVAAMTVTAMTTPIRSYVGELLDQMGLQRTPRALAVVSGGGQTIRVTSAVDDGWVVILGLRAEPGSWHEIHGRWVLGDLSVTDANGRRLADLGWQGNEAQGGDEVLAMFRRPPDGAPVGSPLTLHVQPRVAAGPQPGPGWTLTFAPPASRTPDRVPVPDRGRVGDMTVTFGDVRASDRYIVVVLDVSGPDEREIRNLTGPSALIDPSGAHVPNLHGTGLPVTATDGVYHDHEELYWPRQGSGTYRLTLGNGRLARSLVIR
jgi:hypothetical protein